MAIYQYQAMDHAGRKTAGSMEAQDEPSLSKALAKQGLFLMDAAPMGAAAPAEDPLAVPVSQKSIPFEEVIMFTKQLILLVKASLPLVQSIESLSLQEKNLPFRTVLYALAADLKRGLPPSQAFAKHPQAFDQVYLSLLSAGEASAKVPQMLARIEEYLSFQAELKQKVRTAIMYPAVLLVVSSVVILFLLTFVLPTFVDIFDQFDAPLPLPTRILLRVSTLFTSYWYLAILALLVGGLQGRLWLKEPRNRSALDDFLLRLPILGAMIDAIVLARILRTLSVLVESRVPILKALELTRSTTGQVYYQRLLDQVAEYVSEGKGIALALFESSRFPRPVANMVATAQRTGSLAEVLKLSADHYQKELDNQIQNTFSALEPMFIAVLSVAVATIALCILQPIMNLGTLVG